MPSPPRRPLREAGHGAVELVAGLAVILAPVTALAVTLPAWAETRYAVEAAAVEAGRLAAQTGDATAAEAVAADVVAHHGVDGDVDVDVTVPTDAAGVPAREGKAVARVTVEVPAVDLPAVGAVGGWPLTRTHREPLHPWRGRDPR